MRKPKSTATKPAIPARRGVATALPPAKRSPDHTMTIEATSYLNGLFQEFHEQVHRYQELTQEWHSLEARIELGERTMCLMRDHLGMAIRRTDSAVPRDWKEILRSVRFVGVRLGDACLELIQERKKLTLKEILIELNRGMFRFRTNAPLREIHAALIRQPSVKKVGDAWVWVGEQVPMRLQVMRGGMEPNDQQKAGDEQGS